MRGLPCLGCHHPSGALLPHLFTLTPCGAVYFLWHFPSGRPDWALPSALPFGVRTFLRALLEIGDHLANSNRQDYYAGGRIRCKTGRNSRTQEFRKSRSFTGHFQLTCLWQGQGVTDRARARAGAGGIRTKLVSDAADVPAVRVLVTAYFQVA